MSDHKFAPRVFATDIEHKYGYKRFHESDVEYLSLEEHIALMDKALAEKDKEIAKLLEKKVTLESRLNEEKLCIDQQMTEIEGLHAKLSEKDRFIKEIQGTLELSVDAVLSSKKKCDDLCAKYDKQFFQMKNALKGKLDFAIRTLEEISEFSPPWDSADNRAIAERALVVLRSPEEYNCSKNNEQLRTTDSGKDGIGWCPRALDDSPAHDPWRKK